MDYSWHMRRTHDAISYGGNLAWAKAGKPLNGVRFEVLLDASECDEETSKLKFKLHQGGIVPWRSDITKHEVTATLQWLTNEMEIIYRNNQDLFRTNVIVFQ